MQVRSAESFRRLEWRSQLLSKWLATTRFICEKLEIKFIDEDFEKINNSYQQVREALVKTVRKIHPEYDKVADRLPIIAKFMKKFRTVFSFNYDLLTYWAMLVGKDEGDHEFKDCYIGLSLFEKM